MFNGEQPTIAGLNGLWRRSLLAWPDGRRDTTTWVRWLQGPSFYVDLRQPAGRGDLGPVGGLDQLDLPQIVWLAGQEGFAGEILYDDGFFEWRREVDFQLTTTYSDQGSLCFADGVMIEEGKDIPYIERWHRDSDAGQPMCAMRLEDAANGCRGFIIRHGADFMYARGRNVSAPAGLTLLECVAAAPSAIVARDLIDCEISFGEVTPRGWRIDQSSLPFREGRYLNPLLPVGRSTSVVSADIGRDGRPMERRWTIIDLQGQLGDLLQPPSATIAPVREARS